MNRMNQLISPPDLPVLQNVETDSSVGVDVGVKHFRDEFDHGRLVGVLLAELEGQLEGAVLEGGVVGPEDDGVPQHDVVLPGRAGHARGRVLLEALEVAHEASAGGRGHLAVVVTVWGGGQTLKVPSLTRSNDEAVVMFFHLL